MKSEHRDVARIDRRGARAAIDVRQAAGEVDTAAMYERIRAPRHRWVLSTLAIGAAAAAVLVGVLVAGPQPAGNGIESGDGHLGPAATATPGRGEATTWWCPTSAHTEAEMMASGHVEVVASRLTDVGDLRAWQSEPVGDPGDDIPDVHPQPQTWLEGRAADEAVVVCTFRAEEFMSLGEGDRYASFIATPDGTAHPYWAMSRAPAPWDLGPAASTPLHEAPASWNENRPAAALEVPDVVGMTEQEAIRVLSHAGLAVLTFTKATDDPAMVGVVLGQSPKPGEVSASLPPSGTTGDVNVVIQVGVDVDT